MYKNYVIITPSILLMKGCVFYMANRLNIAMNEDLIKRIDERAQKLNISRSSYISICCNEKMAQEDAIKQIPDLLSAISELKIISDNFPSKKTTKK